MGTSRLSVYIYAIEGDQNRVGRVGEFIADSPGTIIMLSRLIDLLYFASSAPKGRGPRPQHSPFSTCVVFGTVEK